MGYKGVETTEMVMDGAAVPASSILGGEAGRGQGFYQMMDGVEVGRVNVAARACGISIRAFELAIAYAQQRSAFGKPIASTRRSRSSWPRWRPRSRPPTR
jgi:butyryl-CoA dehydrogenase